LDFLTCIAFCANDLGRKQRIDHCVLCGPDNLDVFLSFLHAIKPTFMNEPTEPTEQPEPQLNTSIAPTELKVKKPKKVKPPSRGQRWQDAAQKLLGSLESAREAIESAKSEVEEALGELNDVKGEFEEWRDNLPENLQGSALGEKLNAICDIDLDSIDLESIDIDQFCSTAQEALDAEIPLGFGRD